MVMESYKSIIGLRSRENSANCNIALSYRACSWSLFLFSRRKIPGQCRIAPNFLVIHSRFVCRCLYVWRITFSQEKVALLRKRPKGTLVSRSLSFFPSFFKLYLCKFGAATNESPFSVSAQADLLAAFTFSMKLRCKLSQSPESITSCLSRK